MRVTRNKIESCVDIGDTVYIILGGAYISAIVNGIYDDSLDTDEDLLFYEDIGETWCLCECTARNITQKSH